MFRILYSTELAYLYEYFFEKESFEKPSNEIENEELFLKLPKMSPDDEKVHSTETMLE